jgi:hypothetical protein
MLEKGKPRETFLFHHSLCERNGFTGGRINQEVVKVMKFFEKFLMSFNMR